LEIDRDQEGDRRGLAEEAAAEVDALEAEEAARETAAGRITGSS
jgi:hypothetical protein